ncbi:MAG: aminotransferase class V-fold PLP-dependent enzyme [Myxococcales bacterium]|nr:aminotransferase class V-fold PLP-dependent enzyme [Myxococcales bacterium]
MPRRSEFDPVLDFVAEACKRLVHDMDDRPVLYPDADAVARSFDGPLPEAGVGAVPALRNLVDDGWRATMAVPGPRNFHFVMGGTTPASLGADLVATMLDQVAYTWITSPLGVQLELTALRWLQQLFGLPEAWTGVMVTGASMANFVCYATARQWWGERHGVDPAADGMHGLPPMPVLTSGFVHASTLKTLGMLGIGRRQVQTFAADETGRLDLDAFREGLAALGGAPALVVVNAGEVNTGAFDPVADMVELARAHGCWVHVDGAFGLFARVSQRTAHLVAGVQHADSVTVDGHKWLNVPYDVGYAFTRDHGLMARAFRYTADYLPSPDDPRPTLGAISPESSRRARGLATWATLAAYGRDGVRDLVEHTLDLAQHCAAQVDAAPDLVRNADVPLNIVCFRFDPGEVSADVLDEVNARIGEALITDGRVLAGTTQYRSRTAQRPAFSSWRTRTEDVDLYLEVVRELGHEILASVRSHQRV